MLTTSSDNQLTETKPLNSDCDLMTAMNDQNGINSSMNDKTEEEEVTDEPEVDITISNVVSNFSVKCHLNLRQIASNGSNVVYKREQSVSYISFQTFIITVL